MNDNTAFWPQEMVDYGATKAMIGEPIIIDGPQVATDELIRVSDSIGQVIRLLASLPERTGQTLYEIACWLGFSPEEARVLTEGCDRLDANAYARADVVHCHDGFKLVEINMGAVVGGAMEGSLPWLSGSHQPFNPIATWIDYLGRVIPDNGRGVLIYDGPEGSEWNAHIQIMAEQISQRLGIDMVASRRPVLTWDGVHLRDEHGPFDWVYPVYFPWQVTANPDYYRPIRSAIRERAIAVPVHPSALLLASKKMFALVWKCLENGQLTDEEALLVKTLLPYTCSLSKETLTYAIEHQQTLVLKPSNGHCGLGVVIGHEVSAPIWRASLEQAILDAEDDYLVQQCCEPILEPAVTIDNEGQCETFLARYIWGMFIAQGKFCGTPFMRCRSPEGSLVINCANGAACGPLSRKSSLW
ncbi:hypothetical protein [Pseudomonas mosselii]|uniref:hypothetical protein n=1 Tax=Pseudomonas mosselii TaxID=78327 RepID=UPI000783A909|nr:hypothetical protein [Pseudomonas mosselii]MEA3234655.1 hypothetical protein [Pseudomonas mosselii]UWS65784.1 hypothetical protein N0U38_18630 [Pseudomonas mosselii]